jgi:hypothetical protein
LSGIADYAAEIVGRNGFRGQAKVIHATIEDAQLPEPVDVILSEWMGCCLFFETMLRDVILARD